MYILETAAQLCVALATGVLFIASAVGFATARRNSGRDWRRWALLGVGALSLGVVLRGGVSSLADRATLAAWVAGLLSVEDVRRNKNQAVGLGPDVQPAGWAGLIPIAVVAGVGVVARPRVVGAAAPLVLLGVLAAAGLALWSLGQALDVLLEARADNSRAAAIAFAGLTVSIVVVVGVNWRVWGTPGGTMISAVLTLWAAWLMSATRLLWRRFAWFSGALDGLVAIVVTVVALSVRWTWPFG